MYDVKKLTDICEKYNITPNQFYVLHCIYTRNWDDLFRYNQNVASRMNNGKAINGFNIELELLPLVDKGYLANWGKKNTFEILDLMVTPLFSELLFIETKQAGLELYDTYPQWITVNGSQVVAKKGDNIGGIYYGKDEIIELYAKKIGNLREKHETIIKATERGKEKKLINVALRNYVKDELWEAYMELDEGYKIKSI